MRIMVKYRDITLEVSDNEGATDTRALLYFNEKFSIQLLSEIIDKMIKLYNETNSRPANQ
jgi:hypothetical protein